jgi:excisionase family DNA binding protein
MKIVTVKELSEIINVKVKTLYQWAEMGQIPSIKMQGALRFDLDDIQEWLKTCKRDTCSGYNQPSQARGPR